MKKIILILCTCLLLTGCGERNNQQKAGGEYFTVIKEWNDDGAYKIVYANDTGVKYLIYDGYCKAAITALYNADGSLQLYEESEVEE